MLKFTDLMEDVEYYLLDEHGNKSPHKYKKLKGLLYVKISGHYTDTRIPINHVLKSTFVKCEWMPIFGEVYYFPNFMSYDIDDSSLYDSAIWEGIGFDIQVQRNVGIYRTKEEAIAKSKELGWTQ